MEPPKIKTEYGISYFTIEGPPIVGLSNGLQTFEEVKYAVNMDVLQGLGRRKQFTIIAQLYGIVIPGLVLSAHLFKGLNRNLYYDNSFHGDVDKFIFTRKPAYNYEWIGGPRGTHKKIIAPLDQVFVTLISENKGKHKENFPDVVGWVDHWNWVDEDPVLNEAPLGWVDRYDTKLWSREN